MKLRVLHNTEDGKYYSQYYSEGVRSSGWRDTYKDLHSTVQNRFDTLEEAKEECIKFAESQEKTRIVWTGEV